MNKEQHPVLTPTVRYQKLCYQILELCDGDREYALEFIGCLERMVREALADGDTGLNFLRG